MQVVAGKVGKSVKAKPGPKPLGRPLTGAIIGRPRTLPGSQIGLDELSDWQAAFVKAFTDGPTTGNAPRSAELAGLSKNRGYSLLREPKIKEAIFQQNRALVGSMLVTKAVQYLDQVISDPSLKAAVRLRAAEIILDKGGFGSGNASQVHEKAKKNKPLAEMTQDELEAVIATGAAVLKAAQAGPVIDLDASNHAEFEDVPG